jgi:hypothetical protein
MASFTGGSAIRKILKDDYKLTTKQINATMDYLKGSGATFKGFKDILKGYGIKGGSNLNPLQDTIKGFISSGASTPAPEPVMPTITPTPTPTPTPTVGPTLPTITPTPSPIEDLFPGTGEYEPEPVVGPVMPTITPTPTPTTPTTTDDLKPGEIFRNLLKDLGLTTKQKRKVLDILKAGGRFKDIKGILEGFGVENVGSLKDPVKSYVDFLDIDTPYVSPDIVGPVPIVGPTQPIPTLTPTYTDEELADLFPGTGDYEETPIVGPVQPTPTPTIPTITDILGEIEFPEYPEYDFDALMESQQDAYQEMLTQFEAQQEAAAEEAKLRRLTEMSNMAQGSQIAEFRPSAISQNRGGTTPFKRRSGGRPSLRISPRVNTSLSIGARSQLPGVGYTSNNFGGVPGIMSRKAGSLTRRL